MSATLHKATSRRILTVSDRVLFTQACLDQRSRARDGGEFRVLDALTIAEVYTEPHATHVHPRDRLAKQGR